MAELCNLLACRLCLQKQFQLLPMFPANEPVNDELLRKIYECATVRISYEYDQNSVICIKCIVDVEQFYAFKQRCVENDLLFQKMRLDCGEKGVDESEFENVALAEAEFMEPITNLESPQQYDATKPMDSFIGPSQLVRVGYNYRVVRVNDEADVLVYHKHRFYQPTKATDWNRWVCVANGSNSCPARLTISSKEGFPLALFTKPIRHNHPDTIVQAIGSSESTQENVVQILPQCTLVLDCNQRMRLLAQGYRYRLRQAIYGVGKSLWSCVRPGCLACFELSYEDSRTCATSDRTHCHEVEEEIVPTTSNANTELMTQKQPKLTRGNNGLNYRITDGVLVYSGNYYKAHRNATTNKTDDVWKCMVTDCAAKVQICSKYVALLNSHHNHVKQITKNSNEVSKQTIQHGVNYRLIVEEHGYIRLQHRKQKYTFQKLLQNGSSEWSCIWKGLGCTAMLRMLADEQLVYSTSTESSIKHDHRVGNEVEQYFPTIATAHSIDTNLWSTSAYELLWNRNSKPIIHRQRDRFYGRTAFTNGTIEWHCVRGISAHCEATITIDKSGAIIAEHSVHDHEKSRKIGLKVRSFEQNITTRDIFASPGPVRLLAGGFNYRRMHNDQLNIDIVVHVAHKYLSDGPYTKGYHCILRDEPQACPGKIILTNNALCAEILAAHNHLARTVPKTVEPERSAQVVAEGLNYELMYAMTGRNCLLLHEGHVFRLYKLLEPSQTSRWRCIHAEVGCKAFLSVPLTLTKPAIMDAQPHDHSRVKHDTAAGSVKVKQEIVEEESDEIAGHRDSYEQSPRLRPRVREAVDVEDVKRSLALINPTTSDTNALTMLQDIRGTLIKEEMKREMLQIKPDPDAMTCFLNGHLYVRQFEDLETLDAPEWMCAFRWTLGCNARLSDLSVHAHERFASVRTQDRFNMLKTLISHGLIGQRGAITQMPERQKVSEYELLPSNGNLSLIIDENRYYFYKAKNNGEWLWRCVRYRWQGCKIGVAVSHCFGKYYYQPYGKTEHVHSS